MNLSNWFDGSNTPRASRFLGGLLLVTAVCLLLPQLSLAGVGGQEFDDIYDKLVGYAQGTPGRIVMFLGFVVAAVSAVVAQSIAGFVVGLGIGLGVYYANKLVEGVVTATLPLPGALPAPAVPPVSPAMGVLALLLAVLGAALLTRRGRVTLRHGARALLRLGAAIPRLMWSGPRGRVPASARLA